jgi:hypothetical protein
MRSYAPPVSIRTLLAIFVALAVLLAPAFTRAGVVLAAAPDHHAQMMEAGHCTMPPASSADHDKGVGDDCCISMCMAAAITPAAPVPEEVARPAQPVFALPTFLLAYLGEIATPPPRSA